MDSFADHQAQVTVMWLVVVLACAAGVPVRRVVGGALEPSMPRSRCICPVEVAGLGVGCVLPGKLAAGDRLRLAGSGRVVRDRMAPARLAALEVPVDVNRASAAELASLDGIGAALSARIVARRAIRPFDSLADLATVPGLGGGGSRGQTLARMAARLLIDADPVRGLH